MLSEYFKVKTKRSEFIDRLNIILDDSKDKKVLIYGAGEGFLELNKIYKFSEKLNIVAIADMDSTKKIEGFKIISPYEICNFEFDKILISNESPKEIVNFLELELEINEEKIEKIFETTIPDERTNFLYLKKYNFEKQFEKLKNKLKNKTIVIYGAGVFFQLINEYYDLSKLNILAISDKKYIDHEENEQFLGYKVIAPNEIKNLQPDYVLVATKNFINIIEDLYYNELNRTKIKITPLVKKPFSMLLKEIWG